MPSRTTKRALWAPWNANVWPDREPDFRLQDKQKLPCFLKLWKECRFLSILSHPVCVAAFLLIRSSQEVQQMFPWHPSGPCTPTLPPTGDAQRRTLTTLGPSQGAGRRKKRLSAVGIFTQWGCRYQSVIKQDLWAYSGCFLFVSALSRPFEQQTQVKETHWNYVSWWQNVLWTK